MEFIVQALNGEVRIQTQIGCERQLNTINGLNIPHALQMVRPFSSLLQSGVMVVLQFWHAIMTVDTRFCKVVMSIGAAGSEDSALPDSGLGVPAAEPQPMCSAGESLWVTLMLALLDIRLLYAGQPLQPSAPPVPLQWPPPGHVPELAWSAATYVAPGVADCS